MFDQNDQNQQQAGSAMPGISSAPAPSTAPAAPSAPMAEPMSAPPASSSAPAPDPMAAAASNGFSVPDLSAPSSPPTSSPSMPDPVSAPASDPMASSPATSGTGVSDDLLTIKKDALQSLSPLLGQLDQSPEEKFRTTMMLIQASDDQSLIQTAYASAKEIGDEKVKAQALLDIVNEINYFTQQAQQNKS